MVLASLAPTTIPESVMNPENPKDREVPEAPGEVENSKVLGEPRGFHLTQEVLDTQPLGEVLDALYLNGEEGGYCFVGALLQTYVDNGAELDVTSLVKVMKSAATNEAWNGNPVVQSNGYVNDPDQFLALAARVLHVEPLSTGDTKYREATLRFALDADNRNTPGALNFSNAQTVVDSFREQAFPGQEGNGNVIMELRKGSLTHFVSLSNWDVASMIDPHGGNSRSDWSVASLRVLN
ncbi:MAG: hypothetical protein GW949_02210 [Spirochaetales bacterium]|nr:hypothetical protein [Spirochaetales bacterium]